MTKSIFLKSWFVPGIFSDDQVYLLEELIFTWNLQLWPSLSSWKADLYLKSSVMTNSIFLKSWFLPTIFSDDQVCLIEELICTWNLQWWPGLSSWWAALYLESSMITKCIFLKSWSVPGIFSDDQVYLLEQLICTWNLQWWPSLSSWRADLYLESSVMTKSVFLNSWFLPGIFSYDQVCLLEELIFTWNLQWWPGLSSWGADLYQESSVITKCIFLKSWFVPGIFSDDQVCLLEQLICTWNLQWWPGLSSWRADFYLESLVMTKYIFLKSWFVPGVFSDDQVCLLNCWCVPGIFSDDQVCLLNSWCVPGIFSDDQVCLPEELIFSWNLQWWPSLSSWRADFTWNLQWWPGLSSWVPLDRRRTARSYLSYPAKNIILFQIQKSKSYPLFVINTNLKINDDRVDLLMQGSIRPSMKILQILGTLRVSSVTWSGIFIPDPGY